MKQILLITALIAFNAQSVLSQTAHENFMANKIKLISTADLNTWTHGENDFTTVTADDWNSWSFSYMGLKGTLNTTTTGDWTVWNIVGTDITLTCTDSTFKNWIILGEGSALSLTSSNWNTWAYTGAITSGISTTVTDDFSEWEIQGGDWTALSPNYRVAAVYIPLISSTILKDISQ